MQQNQTIKQYLIDHALSDSAIAKYRLQVGPDRITIPVFDAHNKFLFNKYRMFTGPDKYRYDKGSSMALYNANRITPEVDTIIIVEGEFDCMALQEYYDNQDVQDVHKMISKNIVVVTSTGGAGSWKDEWNTLLEGKRVTICLDNDNAGRDGSMKLWEKIGSLSTLTEVHAIREFKDMCEVLKYEKDHDEYAIIDVMLDNRFNSFLIRDAETPREKVKVIDSMLSLIDEIEQTKRSLNYRSFIMHFRAYLANIYNRERPRKKSKLVWTDGEVTLDQLRQIPIDRFIKFRNNLACCIFHNEKHPSMQYNPPGGRNKKLSNTVKCFSCGRFGGVVDVVMQINNVGFAEAVAILKQQL